MNADYLRRVLGYDPDTGIFCWKTPRAKIVVGAIAGTAHPKGAIRISFALRAKKWTAQIKHNKRVIALGYFYCAKASELHGEFARAS